MNNFYINVTQDGVSRLSHRTPQNILGLVTNNIETCIVYVLIGINGHVSFSHASLSISTESLLNEISWVGGALEKWIIVTNAVRGHERLVNQDAVIQQITEKVGFGPEWLNYPSRRLGVIYNRSTKQVTEFPAIMITPIIMPPFADKALATAFLNGFLSRLNTVNLQLQFNETCWEMTNNLSTSLKKLIKSVELDIIDHVYENLEIPPSIPYETFLFRVKPQAIKLLTILFSSCEMSITEIQDLYVDTWSLLCLQQITGFPFIGTMDKEGYLTAWIFLENEMCIPFVKPVLKQLGLNLLYAKIGNEGNLMTPHIHVIKIERVNVDEVATLLRPAII